MCRLPPTKQLATGILPGDCYLTGTMNNGTPYIDVHTHNHAEMEDQRRIVSLRLEETGVHTPSPAFGSVGVHPWDADGRDDTQDRQLLGQVVEEPWCIAVGEIGLDRVHGPDLAQQRRVLDAQLDIAAVAGLPVIFHCVRAHADLMQLRKQRRDTNPWIIHGFTGHAELAGQLLDMDFHLSFGEALLEIGSKARKALTSMPLDRLFFETDESEVDIRRLYREAADLLFMEETEVRSAVATNFERCFRVQA